MITRDRQFRNLGVLLPFFLVHAVHAVNEEECRLALASTLAWYDSNADRFIAANDATDRGPDYVSALRLIKTSNPAVIDIGCAQGKDIEPESADLIWAMAAFIHIPMAKQVAMFEKVSALLKPGGVSRISYKVGEGERLENRDGFNLLYTDMSELLIRQVISNVPSLEILSIETETDYNRKKVQWIKIFVQKTSASN